MRKECTIKGELGSDFCSCDCFISHSFSFSLFRTHHRHPVLTYELSYVVVQFEALLHEELLICHIIFITSSRHLYIASHHITEYHKWMISDIEQEINIAVF